MFIQSVADLYGASRSLLRMAKRLSKDGHNVCVLLPKQGPLVMALQTAGVEVVLDAGLAYVSRQEFRDWKHILRFPGRMLLSCLRTAALVRQFRPDIIHSNTALVVPGGVVGKLLGVPHIWHVREIFSEFGRSWLFYQWFLYAFSDRIVCNSRASARQFHRRIQREKTKVLHNGYPDTEFSAISSERVRAFRTQYGLNGHRAIGLVGRIRLGRKGQAVFLKAAALLLPKFPDLKFLCVGSPFPGNEEHLDRLERLRAELGLQESFICTGDVEDIKAAYAAFDVSVQCSVLAESFGGVIVESMAMGRPVVATAIGGSLELIDDGVSGLLVEPDNPRALASAVELLLNDEAFSKGLAEGGRARFLAQFEFEAFYASLLTTYSEAKAEEG